MNLLDRYILKEFLKFFAITCASFILLYLIVDFFSKIRMFLSNEATVAQMASYFLYSIPMIVSLTLPAAVLLATLMTYSTLSKFSEITAMKANGISLYRMALPAIMVAAGAAIFLFVFTETITPAATHKTEHIVAVEVQKRPSLGFFRQHGFWYHGQAALYNFRLFDLERNIIYRLTVHRLNPDFSLNQRIDARRAEWKDDHWEFHEVLVSTFNEGHAPVLQWADTKIIELNESPADFMAVQKDADKLGFFDLLPYIQKISQDGYDITKYRVSLHAKIAFPFVMLILVVIGISFSLRHERSGGVMQSLAAGIFIGFSYWIIHALFVAAGQSGKIPVILAAWAANVIFASAAMLLFYRVRK